MFMDGMDKSIKFIKISDDHNKNISHEMEAIGHKQAGWQASWQQQQNYDVE